MELRMKESYGEGVAHHTGPESCAVDRKVKGEALTGVRTGQPLSGEINMSRMPTLLSEAEGHTADGVLREPFLDPAPSETLRTCGNSVHGNREIPRVPSSDGGDGRTGKAKSHAPVMHAGGKSDACIVPEKLPNKDRGYLSAEVVEGRRAIKGNTVQPAMLRTQSRKSVSPGLQRVRIAARKDKGARFTSLLHHVNVPTLKDSYLTLKRQAAPGVDGVTWSEYKDNLDQRLADLHNRVQCGTYRALPSRRVYIPKPDGRKRPLGIAALEDKIVQHAVGNVLCAIYEEDFLGFSYGFRPGRGQHDALDALFVGLTHRKVNWVLDADIKGFFDTISHKWMQRFVEHRIADPRIARLVRKWLRAGASEDGKWSKTVVGTPQGAVISPLLANIYLHYVLDQWVNHWRRTKANGDVVIVRYADDCAPRRRAGGRKSSVQPCCTRDGGRPLEAAVQAEASNHPLLLRSRDVVVSELGKGWARPGQVRIVESNASEPLMTCRKRRDDVKTVGESLPREKSGQNLFMTWAASGMKAARTRSRLLCGTWEPVIPMQREKRKGQPPKCESTKAGYRDGATRSSEESPVMGTERRGCPIQPETRRQLVTGGLS
jgi:retron-type reverse transcriptase